jgi:hypothetical protein
MTSLEALIRIHWHETVLLAQIQLQTYMPSAPEFMYTVKSRAGELHVLAQYVQRPKH